MLPLDHGLEVGLLKMPDLAMLEKARKEESLRKLGLCSARITPLVGHHVSAKERMHDQSPSTV